MEKEKIKYVSIKISEGRKPTIWMYTDEKVLEKDLNNYLFKGDEIIERKEVSEKEASKTEYFGSPGFNSWVEKESGKTQAFNLGKVVDQ